MRMVDTARAAGPGRLRSAVSARATTRSASPELFKCSPRMGRLSRMSEKGRGPGKWAGGNGWKRSRRPISMSRTGEALLNRSESRVISVQQGPKAHAADPGPCPTASEEAGWERPRLSAGGERVNRLRFSGAANHGLHFRPPQRPAPVGRYMSRQVRGRLTLRPKLLRRVGPDARKALVISRQDCNSNKTGEVVATIQGIRIYTRRRPLDRALLNVRDWEKGKSTNGAVS